MPSAPTSPAFTDGAIVQAIALKPIRKGLTRRTLLLGSGSIVVLLIGIATVVGHNMLPAPSNLITTSVQRGTLVRTVTSSGTVNPENTISIGSQISGTISEVDVDYNTVVKTGQVLARIDPTQFQTTLDQALAQLAQTQATARVGAAGAVGANAGIGVQRATAEAAMHNVSAAKANLAAQIVAIAAAQANVAKAQSVLVLAQQTIGRDSSLLSQGYVAQTTVDADRAGLVTAQSGVASAQAAVEQARSQAAAGEQQVNQAAAQSASQNAQNAVAGAQAQASLGTAQAQANAIGIQAAQVRTARYNLAHTTITSPVNGTVIVRNVAIGETVASSFSTPVLFTIAQDLTKMEVDLAVGEPDIGAVRAGETVTFTVLAFPTTFTGTISQVRQSPTVVSNVVTYDTVVVVNNASGQLRPGMTANALIQTQRVTDALIVPLQALAWQPSAAISARYNLPAQATGSGTSASRSRFGATMGAGATSLPAGSRGRIYVERSGALQVVPVQIVLTAATQAAVKPLSGTLQASDNVVIADTSGAQPQPGASVRRTTPGFTQGSQGGGATRALR
jgi:HlyD family secretion protein